MGEPPQEVIYQAPDARFRVSASKETGALFATATHEHGQVYGATTGLDLAVNDARRYSQMMDSKGDSEARVGNLGLGGVAKTEGSLVAKLTGGGMGIWWQRGAEDRMVCGPYGREEAERMLNAIIAAAGR
jgi:hypothetical protein